MLATVDFWPHDDMDIILKRLRKYQPDGPLVNSELYSGECDWYGADHHKTG